MTASEPPPASLRDRRRRQTRERIVETAFALYSRRGFDAVTVDEIAEQAEVGRTTFFRYFGDKQEVVFAREGELLDAVLADAPTPPGDLLTLADSLAQARRLVTTLCRLGTTDPDFHATYHDLVERHPELADRHARKTQDYAAALEKHLAAHGAPRELAVLAAELTLACYRTSWRLAGRDASTLLEQVDRAFDALTAPTR